MFKKIIVILLLTFYSLTVLAAKPVLKIYTVASFDANFAAGGKIKTIFEAECDCVLEYITFSSSSSLVARLKLEGDKLDADLIVGVDDNFQRQLEDTNLFAPHNLDLSQLSVPFPWKDQVFIPYNYGYFAFIYNDQIVTKPPSSFQELVDPKNKFTIIISDPRSSAAGLGLVDWVQVIYQQDSLDAWKKLAPKIVTVTKSWSEAYGLFLKNEADFVLSYTSSPAYHIMEENNHHYKAAIFSEGHYLQIQLAAKLKNAKQSKLAEQFLQFILSVKFQETIPQSNYMYPVINLHDNYHPAYSLLVKPTRMLHFTADQSFDNRTNWINIWLDAMKH